MTGIDLVALSPLIILAAAPVIVMLVISFYRSHAASAWISSAGLVLSFFALFAASNAAPLTVTPLVMADRYAIFYEGLFVSAALIVLLLSYSYNKARSASPEYYILLLLATLGAAVLASSVHFASFFLGLETLSVALYALIAYDVKSDRGGEAGVKYLVLAGVSSGLLLFGMALVYFQTGAMDFTGIAAKAGGAANAYAMTAGFALIAAGVAFKLALFPFHMWTPDVYEGSPAPVAAFVASVSKGAAFSILLRFFGVMDLRAYGALLMFFAIIAVLSMFAGNLLALFQNNVKRVLAYSSIAHMGYLLVALLASGALSVTAAGYYLAAYFVSILGAFGAVILLSGRENEREMLEEYRGMASANPWLSGVLAGMLFSLAGIPLTAGFIGKFYLVLAGVGSALWLLVLTLIINSVISLYYYLRIIAVLYSPAPDGGPSAPAPISIAGGIGLSVLTVLLVSLGVYPAPFIRLVQITLGSLM